MTLIHSLFTLQSNALPTELRSGARTHTLTLTHTLAHTQHNIHNNTTTQQHTHHISRDAQNTRLHHHAQIHTNTDANNANAHQAVPELYRITSRHATARSCAQHPPIRIRCVYCTNPSRPVASVHTHMVCCCCSAVDKHLRADRRAHTRMRVHAQARHTELDMEHEAHDAQTCKYAYTHQQLTRRRKATTRCTRRTSRQVSNTDECAKPYGAYQ